MDKIKTGALIKEARLKKNYTQSELGDLLGVTNRAISRWENGESFPDVGILENLANILDIKIQDIVTGETEADREEAVTEIVRVAKLQQAAKRKRTIAATLAVILLFCSLLSAFYGFSGRVFFGDAERPLYTALLTITLACIVLACILNKDSTPTGIDRQSKILTLVSALTCLWTLLIMAVTLHIVINGGTPLGIGEEKVGPFLLYQFMAVYVINLIIIIIETKALAYKHLLLPTATTYLAILYGEMLYNIESPEGTIKALALTAIVVLAEFAISYIIVTAVSRMRKQ